MKYSFNKLRKALNKLAEIKPHLLNSEIYGWDDGGIYINTKDGDTEVMKMFEKIYGTVPSKTSA